MIVVVTVDKELGLSGLRVVGRRHCVNFPRCTAKWSRNLSFVRSFVFIYRDQVLELGGLYVVGTSRHESRRVDNQLRGRAGRQGDPGATRFFLSLDDDVFRCTSVCSCVRACVPCMCMLCSPR